ncbi:MAG: hypothetical protein DRH37_09310 [Deltaproteobacteria bacterium]|nr:MAG: hypothetical protein DRH37_09310 [Deltaproteobacteria bacterium]
MIRLAPAYQQGHLRLDQAQNRSFFKGPDAFLTFENPCLLFTFNTRRNIFQKFNLHLRRNDDLFGFGGEMRRIQQPHSDWTQPGHGHVRA